ncbi:hypothetical protein [Mariniblastus fucicola]|uniref:Leucine Rich repeats (2 copies) n=1 Tax=Mariniblastus fucicola TaxID=980251 RepID=A0A5B9PKD2_9BACT|nr:hypothetical protein [Mariniblastus fucicola]QEG25182.1 hypothetical protein MFFC18_51060 [Mariniblastus fucicola]
MKQILFVVCAGVLSVVLLIYATLASLSANGEIRRQRFREKIVADVDPLGQTSVYDGELLSMLADNERGRLASSLVLVSADLADPAFQRIVEFENLGELGMYSCENMKEFLATLKKLNRLESIFVETTSLPDGTFESFASLPNLKKLHLEQTVPAESIESFNELRPDVEVKCDFVN